MNRDSKTLKTEKGFFKSTIVPLYRVVEFVMKYIMILIMIMGILVIVASIYFKTYESIGAGVFLFISSGLAYLVFFRGNK